MTRRPRIYVGHIDANGEHQCLVVPLDGGESYPLPPRNDLFNHSPDGFHWGYAGSGPAQLALAILADHLGDDARAVDLHQSFKGTDIQNLDQDRGWVLSQSDIDEALGEILEADRADKPQAAT